MSNAQPPTPQYFYFETCGAAAIEFVNAWSDWAAFTNGGMPGRAETEPGWPAGRRRLESAYRALRHAIRPDDFDGEAIARAGRTLSVLLDFPSGIPRIGDHPADILDRYAVPLGTIRTVVDGLLGDLGVERQNPAYPTAWPLDQRVEALAIAVRRLQSAQAAHATETPAETPRQPADVFPPGVFLKEELVARNWTADDLGARTALGETNIWRLLSGEERVTPMIARRLANALDTSPDFWINLQAAWDGRGDR